MLKKFKQLLVVTSLFSLLFVFAVQADTYNIDPSHSYVMWRISHFGFSNPSGKWFVNGSLVLDEANPQNSKVNVTVKVDEVNSGIPKLDTHLKSEEFFNTTKFPTATFVSDKVELINKSQAKVHGQLTVHGITKPIVLNVTLNKIGISPITNKKTAGFTATANLKRSDFGMNTYLPGLGDDVQLQIEAEATKAG